MPELKDLPKMALRARARAYAPYSSFQVGAALLCDDGSVYTGCNIENAAYSVTCCAERVALFSAVSAGRRAFRAIAIAGGPAGDAPREHCAPCGVCRQALAEFADEELCVLLVRDENDVQMYRLGDLLPASFSKKAL